MHRFDDNNEVVQALNGLIDRKPYPLVVRLPRTPGRKDSEYMHLFSGDVDIEAHAAGAREEKATGSRERHSVAELEERISRLEAEVAALREKLG